MGKHKKKKNKDLTMHVVDSLSEEERIEHARIANEAMDTLRATGAEPNTWLREQFTRELVFGVWQDARETGGIGVAILKGKGRMMLVAQGSRSYTISTAYIRCKDLEEAEAMCQVFGDGRRMAA